jgi:hypothetical protein
VGIPAGSYTGSRLNKRYAIRAVTLLRRRPELSDDLAALWRLASGDDEKTPNNQMEVVVALFRAGLIAAN